MKPRDMVSLMEEDPKKVNPGLDAKKVKDWTRHIGAETVDGIN